ADHWDLVDCIAVLTTEHKPTGSTAGHSLAATSPIQAARVADAPRRLDLCRSALIAKDFDAFAEIVEQDSNLMHAVMLTSQPSLIYWQPETLAVMQAVQAWRREGLPACFTIDAGPNVHVISPRSAAEEAAARLSQLGGVQQVISAPPGGAARLVAS
ncbi:MAG: diphosphomevalonate decarboxylase, partial [Anaerolineae bacterium]|nr:diphosphomevalonate decarboxylase [Anaerolineae bacterium]